VHHAWQSGAPKLTLARMLGNVGADFLLGAIPLIGNLFDFAWKANRRNARLLEEHVAEALDEKGRHYLSRIRDGASSMGRLVDDLLALARIGQQDLQPVPTDLGELVAEVLEEVEAEAGDREIVWSVGTLPEVKCDPGLLRIALNNLLSNAVKYTRPTPAARIDVDQRTDGAELTVTVRDNGVGFDMRYADKLFGVFQRLHPEEDFEGQGVGLATVQRIIHKHGGRIWADARPGEGAAFSFTLPVDVPAMVPR